MADRESSHAPLESPSFPGNSRAWQSRPGMVTTKPAKPRRRSKTSNQKDIQARKHEETASIVVRDDTQNSKRPTDGVRSHTKRGRAKGTRKDSTETDKPEKVIDKRLEDLTTSQLKVRECGGTEPVPESTGN